MDEEKKVMLELESEGRVFRVYYDGQEEEIYEVVKQTIGKDRTKEKEVWKTRKEVAGGLHAPIGSWELDTVRSIWADKHCRREEMVKDLTSRCQVCEGPMEMWKHIYYNADKDREESYLFRKCADCGRRILVPNSHDPPVKGL